MNKRVQWQSFCDTLGETPSDWLAKNYPDAGDNTALAKTLADALGHQVTRIAISTRASVLGLHKSEEAKRGRYEQTAELLRLSPAPATKRFIDWPTMESKRFCIASDWHIPFYDPALATRMFLLCQHWDPPIKDLIIGGDFYDFAGASKWFDSDPDMRRTVEDDLREGEYILIQLAEWFERILVIRGNHENRLYTGKLGKEISFDRLSRMMTLIPDKITFSKWPFCVVNEKWRITHPKPFWKNPLSLARELASIHLQHIIMAHGHGMAVGRDKSGMFMAIDSGGMMDPQKIEYVSMVDTAHGKWCPGFLIIEDDKVHVFNETWTPWEFYREALDIPRGW